MTKQPAQTLLAAWPLVRDVIIVIVALGLIVYEAVFYDGQVRQPLIIAYVGLLASPVFLRSDAKDRSDDSTEQRPGEVDS